MVESPLVRAQQRFLRVITDEESPRPIKRNELPAAKLRGNIVIMQEALREAIHGTWHIPSGLDCFGEPVLVVRFGLGLESPCRLQDATARHLGISVDEVRKREQEALQQLQEARSYKYPPFRPDVPDFREFSNLLDTAIGTNQNRGRKVCRKK